MICVGSSLSILEYHGISRNIMEYHDAMVRLGRSLAYTRISWNIKQHRGITRNIMMSWSWKLAACTRIPWDIEEYLRIGWSISPRGISLHILENLRMWVAWNIMMSWSAVEAHCILYWNTLKIVEYRGISWNAMKNHDVMVCLGSSLNILEYH